MKKIKKLILLLLFLTITILIMPNKKDGVNASSNLVVVKGSTGSDLTYRNSTEKIYRLAEYNYPTNQLRACWVSVFVGDIPVYQSESQYKSAINEVLDNMEKMGMNAIVYHVRTHNNAMYKSKLNPRASWWSGVNFDVFDPLEWTIEECHRRGIEFHAWLNPYRVSSNGTNSCNISGDIPEVNPANDWNNLIKSGSNVILDPGIPENRSFIIDTCMEIVENYDVDAIHFDDYFYISGADDSITREKYNTENLSIANFRRKQVDLFIEELSNDLRRYNAENNRCVQLGISPSNIYQNGGYSSGPKYDANGNLTAPLYSNTAGFAHYGDYLYSDTLNWINHEWIDYIMPQAYHPIEQTSASYAEVVKWWSWAVRYKKVNLYTGIGIYMVFENNQYWKRNVNEVELQLLIAGQYPEFKGACFYKYSNLTKTYNDTVKHAVDTISNDFWKKRIPGAVLQYYAQLIDEVEVKNLKYDSNTKTISWDSLENVRGYMVYQVPKGGKLDKSDIKHVYKYTQETTIVINDDVNYDYYVSSVNLANEISNPSYVLINISSSDVINLIANLKEPVDFNNIDEIKNARLMYEMLSEEEKSKVTNIDKLIRLEASLNNYDTLKKALNSYINSLDKHIKTNRVLPVNSNITISYKNESDKELYDIKTGIRVKEYLAPKIIKLIATLNEGGLSISEEFEVNIGYTSINQTGLFYRNDASSMGVNDEGEYGPGNSKYIGWSGHTIVVDNYLLFIAKNNYFEISDSNDIPSCNWSSVAGVYVNKTNQNITMTLGNAFSSKSCDNDGYFIISNNKIKKVEDGFDVTKIITLEPDEVVVIVRYLDNQLNGSPLTPVSKIAVGTKSYLDNENEETSSDLAEKIVEKINSITTPISLNQEFYLISIKEEYNNLDEEAKKLVTNYQKLLDYLAEIGELKQALNIERTKAINNIFNYLDITLYTKENQKIIQELKEQARLLINEATEVTAINRIVSEYQVKLDAILTIEEELVIYKADKIESLVDLVNYELYDDNGKKTINDIINEGKLNINNAKDKLSVDGAYDKILKDISQVKTIEQLEKELEDYKKIKISELRNYLNQENYSDVNKKTIQTTLLEISVDINNSLTIAEIDELVKNCKNMLDEIPTKEEEIEAYKQKSINELMQLLNDEYDEDLKEQVADVINQAIILINTSKTQEEIEKINISCKNYISNIIDNNTLNKEKDKYILKLDNLSLTYEVKNEIKKIVDNYITTFKDLVLNEENIDNLENIYIDAKTTIDTYLKELSDAKNIAKSNVLKFIEQLDYCDNEKNVIKNLFVEFEKEIDEIAQVSEVDLYKDSFTKKVVDDHSDLEDLKKSTISTINESIKDTYTIGQKDYLTKLIVSYTEQIKLLGTKADVVNCNNLFTKDLDKYIEDTNKKIAEIIEYLDGNKYDSYVDNLIKDAKSKLNQKSTISELEEIKEQFRIDLNEYLNKDTNKRNCNCSSNVIIYTLLLVCSISTLFVIKKYAIR